MINDRMVALSDYPFRRLASLLEDSKPPDGAAPIIMSIGEPKHPYPALVTETLAAEAGDWGRYPPTIGTPGFRAAVTDWLTARYALPDGMLDSERHILPCNGTREALFTIALLAVPSKIHGCQPTVLMPDPFYQVYAGAAILAGAEPVFVAATAESSFLPDFAALPENVLARATLAYLCTPANPQGTVADLGYLEDLLRLARRHDFTLAIDACYGEIYGKTKPPGILETCRDGDLQNVIAFHSLSKRSNVPGMRSGFVVGDADLMADYARLRSYSGGASPLPVLAVATALWRDEAHVVESRDLYRRKFDVAEQRLGNRAGFYRPDGGFYLWLDVGDGEATTRRLWHGTGIKAMPGAYLSHGEGASSPGGPYIRLALVHDLETTEDALDRLAGAL